MKYIHALYRSFYDRHFYAEVGQKWEGPAFLYLFFLVFISSIFMTLYVQKEVRNYLESEGEYIAAQFPEITILNGELSIDRPEPYFVYTSEQQPIIVFDTTGRWTAEEIDVHQALVTDTMVHIKMKEHEMRSYDVREAGDIVITGADVFSLFQTIADWTAPITFVVLVISLFILRIFQMLIYAMFGLVIAKLMGAMIDYMQLIRLSAVAITPVIVLDIIFFIVMATPPSWPWLGFALAMAYLFYGIRANRDFVLRS